MDEAERDRLEASIRDHQAAGRFDAAATAALQGYGAEILAFLMALGRDEDKATEAFSLFCEDLWRGLPSFAWMSSFRTWAHVVARRASLRVHQDLYERRRVRLATSEAENLSDEIRARTLPHLRTAAKDELRTLRSRLDRDEQILLTLRVDRGLEWTDIARVLADGSDDLDEDALRREAAKIRKRFQRVKVRLRVLAEASGLLERYRE